MSQRHVYTATMPDGTELMVEWFTDDDGKETGVFAATRERPEAQLVWGPPTRLVRR